LGPAPAFVRAGDAQEAATRSRRACTARYAPDVAQPSPGGAVRTLEEGHRSLTALFEQLTDEQLERPSTIGGGDWSARDLMAHIEVWEALALQSLQEWRNATRPSIEDVFSKGSDGVDALNAERAQAKRGLSLDEVRIQAADTHRELIEELSHIGDEEWNAKALYETERRTSLGKLLGSVVGASKRPFGHAFAHLPDLDAYVSSVRDGA
jgi:hypothetical protein